MFLPDRGTGLFDLLVNGFNHRNFTVAHALKMLCITLVVLLVLILALFHLFSVQIRKSRIKKNKNNKKIKKIILSKMFLVKAVFLGILLEAGVTGSYLGENDVFHNLTLKERYQSIVNKLQQHLMNDFTMDSLVRQLARNTSNTTSECTKHFLNMNKAQLISSK